MSAAAGSHAHSILAPASTPTLSEMQEADAQEDDHSLRPPMLSPRRIMAVVAALVTSVGLAAVAWGHNSSGTLDVGMSTSSASTNSGTADLVTLAAAPKPKFAGTDMPCSDVMPCWAGCLCAPAKKDPADYICQPVDGLKDCKYGVKAAYHHLDKANQALEAIKAKIGRTAKQKSSTEKVWKAAAKTKQETATKTKKLHEKNTKLAKSSSFKEIKKEHAAKVAQAEAVLKRKIDHLHQVEHDVMDKGTKEVNDAEQAIVHLRKVVIQTNSSELKKAKTNVGAAQKTVKGAESHEWKLEHLALDPIIQAKKKMWQAASTKTHADNDRTTKATVAMIAAEDHMYKTTENYKEAAKKLDGEDVKVNKWLDALRV